MTSRCPQCGGLICANPERDVLGIACRCGYFDSDTPAPAPRGNSPKVKAALDKVCSELTAMSPEELVNMLDNSTAPQIFRARDFGDDAKEPAFPEWGSCSSCGEPFYTRTDAHSHACGGKPATAEVMRVQYSGRRMDQSMQQALELAEQARKFTSVEIRVLPHEDYDALITERDHWKNKYGTYVDKWNEENALATRLKAEREKLKAENDRLSARMFDLSGLDKESFDAVNFYIEKTHELRRELSEAKIQINGLRAERDEWAAKYCNIETANKELTRNDHVNFGKLIQERDELREKKELMRRLIRDAGDYGMQKRLDNILAGREALEDNK